VPAVELEVAVRKLLLALQRHAGLGSCPGQGTTLCTDVGFKKSRGRLAGDVAESAFEGDQL
jgi:hypothetical protein